MLLDDRVHREPVPPASADLFETAGVGDDGVAAEPLFDSSQAEPVSDRDGSRRPEVVRDIADASADLAADVDEGKPRSKRKLAGGLVVLVVLAVCGGLAAWFLMGSGGARRARVPVNRTNEVPESEEAATRRAIETATGPGVTFNDGSTVRPLASAEPSPVQNSISVTELPSNNSLTTTAESDRPAGTLSSSSGDPAQAGQSLVAKIAGSNRNSERSVQISAGANVVPSTRAPGAGDGEKRQAGTAVVPSFGSILPVRSLGVIYTLRSGALVRFELTRDVKGKGWSLPRGTVLVGAMRGAEHDRVFISLVGFIDSDSDKFVRLGGDVLGADGGAGVRGKRRSMSGKWSRVFRRLGEAGLNVAGRVAGGIGRGPIIITDAYGQTAARVGSEFDGIFSDRNKDSFVEVAAGATCYVMITDLPETIQGVDAVSKLSRSELQEKSDADERRRATGISEREMAELLESGDASRLRSALPRMTAEMRKLAEAVLAEGGNE